MCIYDLTESFNVFCILYKESLNFQWVDILELCTVGRSGFTHETVRFVKTFVAQKHTVFSF